MAWPSRRIAVISLQPEERRALTAGLVATFGEARRRR
jgi:hypothetical protein